MRTLFKNCLPSVIPNASRAIAIARGIVRNTGRMIVTKSSHAMCCAFLICLMLFAFAPVTIQAQDKVANVVNGSQECVKKLDHAYVLILLGAFGGVICTSLVVFASNRRKKRVFEIVRTGEFVKRTARDQWKVAGVTATDCMIIIPALKALETALIVAARQRFYSQYSDNDYKSWLCSLSAGTLKKERIFREEYDNTMHKINQGELTK